MKKEWSAGELLLRRRLKSHTNAGVEHYDTGQHKATIVNDHQAILGWCDLGGAACLCFPEKKDDTWYLPVHRMFGIRMSYHGLLQLNMFPKNWTLSEGMIRALQRAEKSKVKEGEQ